MWSLPMTENLRDNSYAKLESAPYAVRGFFKSIIQHFERKNDVLVHHTDTNGGDLRLAIPPELLGQNGCVTSRLCIDRAPRRWFYYLLFTRLMSFPALGLTWARCQKRRANRLTATFGSQKLCGDMEWLISSKRWKPPKSK